LKVIYSARYEVGIGAHVFPVRKYRLVHARLLESGIIAPGDVIEPPTASWDQLAVVHTREYLDKMRDGAVTPEELAQLELPWSPAIVDGFRTMVGGTVLATMLACDVDRGSWFDTLTSAATESAAAVRTNRPEPFDSLIPNPSKDETLTPHRPVEGRSIVVHLGGGLHHAFANHGEGFCPFNDVAVAIRALQAQGVERTAIVDLDVHHGNGTAFIFEADPRVFTFSMHQQYNYPAWKPRGSLDIGLADGTHDQTYLQRLKAALPTVIASRPQCVFYLAGADPYEDDQLGGLRLTREGLRARDRMVIDAVQDAGAPLVITLAGGYARRVEDTVAIHVATVEEARDAASKAQAKGAATKARRHEEE
jgi:acetoin utilization deacetylase AcuC-like enzyme